MQDGNITDDLQQLAHGQVKALEYSRYDINRYHFWTVKLVTSANDSSGVSADYYGILQKIIEYTLEGAKELKVMFFECDWFDQINDTRVDDFSMVEVNHESCYSDNNILLAHKAQQVYYLSYPHQYFKNWCTWKVGRRRMSLMCVKNKLKNTKISRYQTGQDSHNFLHMTLS
jgi:hypothetical protein